MILNGYAILDILVTLLRLGLVFPVVWLALSTWLRWRNAPDLATRFAVEDRSYLLFLLAGVLVALNLLAWPLLYLLLQSYVPEWPGVMCIYGVTRIGTGSVGTSRHLPFLLEVLQASKPLLVFLSGGWFVLHLINRRTQTAPLTGHILLGVLATGLLAGVDSVAELAYLLIPKKEVFLAHGCCTAFLEDDHGPLRFAPPQLLEGVVAAWLIPVYLVVNAGMVVALLLAARACHRQLPTRWLAPLLGAGVFTLAVNGSFVTEVAAPALLHMPDHHCPYDLVSQAPPSVVAIGLFVAATFCVGWGCCAGWLASGPELRPLAAGLVCGLFNLAAIGYGSSLSILVIELSIA